MTHTPYQSLFHSGTITVVIAQLLKHTSASKDIHQYVVTLGGFVLIATEEFTAGLGNCVRRVAQLV
jgi:hypothetical protein